MASLRPPLPIRSLRGPTDPPTPTALEHRRDNDHTKPEELIDTANINTA